eukprot:362938-Chlamydomonas_euryale.AAC.10
MRWGTRAVREGLGWAVEGGRRCERACSRRRGLLHSAARRGSGATGERAWRAGVAGGAQASHALERLRAALRGLPARGRRDALFPHFLLPRPRDLEQNTPPTDRDRCGVQEGLYNRSHLRKLYTGLPRHSQGP